jgi:hypothetical protein
MKQLKQYSTLLILFITLQLILSFFTIPNHSYANLTWYIEIAGQMYHNGFFNVWTPYPPIFPMILYGSLVTLGTLSNFLLFWKVLNVFFVLCITVLIYKIIKEYKNKETALLSGFAYLLINATFQSTVTIGFFFDQFDYIPIALMLLSLYLLQKKKPTISAIFCSIGIMTKLFPGVILLVAMTQGAKKQKFQYVTIALLTCMVIAAPYLTQNPTTITSWMDFTASRPGWETIWHYPTEQFPPIPDTATLTVPFTADERPYSWLMWITLIGMLGYLWWQKKQKTQTPITRMTLVLLLILLIFAKGISTYFIFWIFPLLFIEYKPKTAFTIATLLLVIVNLEFLYYWPSIIARHILLTTLLLDQVISPTILLHQDQVQTQQQ